MKIFKARYPGRCGGCDTPFDAGDPVGYDADGALLAMDGCDGGAEEELTAAEIRRQRCPNCFTIHTGDCW